MNTTLTKEIKEFISTDVFTPNTKLINSEALGKIGLTNCKNITDNTKPNDGCLYFTKKELTQFAEKYDLYIADLQRFTGAIPENCVKTIEKYLLNFPSLNTVHVVSYNYIDDLLFFETEKSLEELNIKKGLFRDTIVVDGLKYKGKIYYTSGKNRITCRNFKIVAPLSELNIDDAVVEGRSINNSNQDDPAIFEYLSDIQLYRLITCWGKEQSAEELQNSKMN